MKKEKLVIISHTQHYTTDGGLIVGWGSTVNEVNFLADYWDEVCHVACLHDTKAPPSSLPYTKSNIRFIPIPPYGGKRSIDKILIVSKIPIIIYRVIKSVHGASEVQLRLPTSMGLFLLPLFSFFLPRKFTLWVKYAGNWDQKKPPLSYRMQRFWLQKNWARCKVTINGFWKNQPTHCLSFENPCLTVENIEKGKLISEHKLFKPPFVFTFVGRLEKAKGVDRIIEVFESLNLSKVAQLNFIGDGNTTSIYKKRMAFLNEKVVFHGFLSNTGVHEILSKSHFLLLPSDSEGFPKVIAEAACYGVVPIVSNVGSIAHYINDKNGFVWDISSKNNYSELINAAITTEEFILNEKSIASQNFATLFTFMNYYQKLNKLVFTK